MKTFSKRACKDVLAPFFMSIALLTRLPVTGFLPQDWSDKALGRSALWYPFVGLLLGILLVILVLLLPQQSAPLVVATLVVTLWVLLTGALHLDGLADCVDAMYAGHAVIKKEPSSESEECPKKECPKKQTLFRVLKDPNVGAMGVIALMLLLVLKVSLISMSSQLVLSMLVAVVVSRSAALAFIVITPYTPYASKAGLGAVLAVYTPKKVSMVILLCVFVGLLFILPVVDVFILLVVQLMLFYCWRNYWVKQLGGFVGDAIGALIELSEVTLLLTLYFLFL
jgi:adenosylcobinamide-GDP ribazoletransferase